MTAATVLVDFVSPDAATPPLRAAFAAPGRVLVAESPGEVRGVLDAVQAEAAAGRWCVGYVTYEAAPAFDPALLVHPPLPGPLAWFGVFDAPEPWPDAGEPWLGEGEGEGWPDADAGDASTPARRPEASALSGSAGSATPAIVDWQVPLQADAARDAIADIHRRIRDGEVYQINHTARMIGRLREGSAQALFAALQRAQPGTYAALIDTGVGQVLSVSPELFFDWRADGTILMRPMKGTAARGATPADDAARAAGLRASEKERAENLMIVDLVRNDLSRIAELHSVTVPRLFHTEPLPTVWSMTSDVRARTRPGTTLADVFGVLFPCGSVTGAPKVQAMRTIRGLEPDPRGVYCGAIGVVRPGGAATFNVAIRTVQIDSGGEARCGIGSGITIDAGAAGEWAEWLHKAAFVIRASAPFALLETFCLDDGVARHLDDHLARLAATAGYFGYRWTALEQGETRRAVADLVVRHPRGRWRARLLLHGDGRIEVEAAALADPVQPVRVSLAAAPLHEAQGEFVRFKTTRRGHYDVFAPAAGCFDTLLWNDAGELTEFTRGNVAVRLDGRWITPPLAAGLLPGIGRARALADGRITEGVVRVEDLPRADGLAFLNSLRGWIDVQLDKA